MKNFLFLIIALGLFACTSSPSYYGKYYSFSDAGDYSELWIGDGRALTYVPSIDQFFLYAYQESGDTLHFDLIESEILEQHQFSLKIRRIEDNALVTAFIAQAKQDTLKPYFVIDRAVPEIFPTLAENSALFEEIRNREAAGGHSHEGHNH